MRKRSLGSVAVLAMAMVVVFPGVAAASSSVTVEGRLVSVHGDGFGSGPGGSKVGLDTGKRFVRLAGDRAPGALGQRFNVRGKMTGGGLVADRGGVRPAKAPAEDPVAATNKNVAVILFNFSDNTSQPYTKTTAENVFFNNANSVANWFAEGSYGKISMTGTVYGWYTISNTSTSCSYTSWATAADAAAAADGFSASNFTNVVYAFPSTSACGWGGLAYLPGTKSWNNGSMNLRVNTHELTHNYGAHHASTANCSSGGVRVSFSTSCTLSEYGDPFTVMGSSSKRHNVNVHRWQVGYLTSADVQTVTTNGTYTVTPASEPTGAPKIVRVKRPGVNEYIYLEIRSPYGTQFDNFTSTDPAVTGVSIRLGPDVGTRTQSKLLDMTPATSTYSDAPLAVGQTFVNDVDNITFKTLSVGASGAQVEITFGGGGTDTQPPTTPGNFNGTSTSETTVSLSWTASTDNVGVTGYRVRRGSTILGTTTGLTWNDSGLTAGTTYSYSVEAYDAAGNNSPQATTSVTTPTDATPPSSPTLTGSKAGTKIKLSWTASTDNVGVKNYRVYRNGVLIKTTTKRSLTNSPGKGTWTYYVVATDAAGNVSAPSNQYTVTV